MRSRLTACLAGLLSLATVAGAAPAFSAPLVAAPASLNDLIAAAPLRTLRVSEASSGREGYAAEQFRLQRNGLRDWRGDSRRGLRGTTSHRRNWDGPRRHWRGESRRHWRQRSYDSYRRYDPYGYRDGVYLDFGIPSYGQSYDPAPYYYAPPRRVYRTQGLSRSHIRWCQDRYRSYRPRDNSFVTYGGKRRQCWSPYS